MDSKTIQDLDSQGHRAGEELTNHCQATDNWIKVIIEFLGSKIENVVSLDW
jgi:hypothetical protein